MVFQKAMDTIDERLRMLEEAANYVGRPRERLVAVSEAEDLFSRLCPQYERALQIVRIASQLGRTSAPPIEPVSKPDNRVIGLLMGIIRDGSRNGDLSLSSSLRPEEMAFTLWALSFGIRALMRTRVATEQLAIEDGHEVGRQSLDLLLDSLGWRPLASEFDYDGTRQQVRRLLSHPRAPATPRSITSRLGWHRTRFQPEVDLG